MEKKNYREKDFQAYVIDIPDTALNAEEGKKRRQSPDTKKFYKLTKEVRYAGAKKLQNKNGNVQPSNR